MGRHFLEPWIPLRRISVLRHSWGGAGKFRKLAAGRNWSLLLVRRDRTLPSVPVAERPTLRQAVSDADREVWDAAQAVIDAHVAAYHPGQSCRENERGEPQTFVVMDGQPGRPEGIVLRSETRSVIAKARFQDYERTLKRRGGGR